MITILIGIVILFLVTGILSNIVKVLWCLLVIALTLVWGVVLGAGVAIAEIILAIICGIFSLMEKHNQLSSPPAGPPVKSPISSLSGTITP
jgi:lysylphosphatidylglycerol synthetase-like protein (DUF2156 family)